MLPFDIEYSEEKNELLRKTRGICFEDVKDALESDGYISIIEHTNKQKYSHQYVLVVKVKSYVCAVPFIWNKKTNIGFLKTVYPDRKLTKSYLNK